MILHLSSPLAHAGSVPILAVTAVGSSTSSHTLILDNTGHLSDKTHMLISTASGSVLPKPSAQSGNAVSTPFNTTVILSSSGVYQTRVTDDASLTTTRTDLPSCHPQTVFYSSHDQTVYVSCHINQSRRIRVYRLKWTDDTFEIFGESKLLPYAGSVDPIEPIFLDPYRNSNDVTMVTADDQALLYYTVSTTALTASQPPDGCPRVLRVAEVLVTQTRKLLLLCSESATGNITTSTHIDDLVFAGRTQHYTLPTSVTDHDDTLIRHSPNGALVAMATGSQVTIMRGTSSEVRMKQFSDDVSDILLVSDSVCVVVIGSDMCYFSPELLFTNQVPQCVGVSTTACAPPNCPVLQRQDGHLLATSREANSYNLTVYNTSSLENIDSMELRVAPEWLLITPAPVTDIPTPSSPSSSTAAYPASVRVPQSPTPSSPIDIGNNLNTMLVTTVSLALLAAVLVIVAAVVVLSVVALKYKCSNKGRSNAYELTSINGSTTTSPTSTPVMPDKFPPPANTYELTLTNGSTTTSPSTPVMTDKFPPQSPPSNQPSQQPVSTLTLAVTMPTPPSSTPSVPTTLPIPPRRPEQATKDTTPTEATDTTPVTIADYHTRVRDQSLPS